MVSASSSLIENIIECLKYIKSTKKGATRKKITAHLRGHCDSSDTFISIDALINTGVLLEVYFEHLHYIYLYQFKFICVPVEGWKYKPSEGEQRKP